MRCIRCGKLFMIYDVICEYNGFYPLCFKCKTDYICMDFPDGDEE